MLNLINANRHGIALILFCGVVGFFCGSIVAGLLVGVGIVALATIFG